jgi:hypothetical protein
MIMNLDDHTRGHVLAASELDNIAEATAETASYKGDESSAIRFSTTVSFGPSSSAGMTPDWTRDLKPWKLIALLWGGSTAQEGFNTGGLEGKAIEP